MMVGLRTSTRNDGSLRRRKEGTKYTKGLQWTLDCAETHGVHVILVPPVAQGLNDFPRLLRPLPNSGFSSGTRVMQSGVEAVFHLHRRKKCPKCCGVDKLNDICMTESL